MDDKVNYMDAFSLQNTKEAFEKLLALPLIKSASGGVVAISMWLFGGNTAMIWAILSLILADTVTGVVRRIKDKTLSARGFFKFANKTIIYLILLSIAALVDKAIPSPFAVAMVGSFLAVTEGISTLENLSIMGFPVPKALIDKLEALKPDVEKKE